MHEDADAWEQWAIAWAEWARSLDLDTTDPARTAAAVDVHEYSVILEDATIRWVLHATAHVMSEILLAAGASFDEDCDWMAEALDPYAQWVDLDGWALLDTGTTYIEHQLTILRSLPWLDDPWVSAAWASALNSVLTVGALLQMGVEHGRDLMNIRLLAGVLPFAKSAHDRHVTYRLISQIDTE